MFTLSGESNMWPGQWKGIKLAQNTPYYKIINILSSVYIQHLLSVSCKMLPIKFFIDGKISLLAWTDH